MFENVGAKIRGLAQTIFALYLLVGIIGAIVMMTSGANFFIALLMLALVGVIGYLSVIIIYAFGTLVYQTERIADHICNGKAPSTTNVGIDMEKIANSIRDAFGKGKTAVNSIYTQVEVNEEEKIENDEDMNLDVDRYLDIISMYSTFDDDMLESIVNNPNSAALNIEAAKEILSTRKG